MLTTKMTETIAEPRFTKSQLVSSKRFHTESDLLNALLQEDKAYTMNEVEKKITDFKKGKVD